MLRYRLFIFTVANHGLLDVALDSVKSIWPHTTVINNTGGPLALPVPTINPPVPLTYAQSFNYARRLAIEDGCEWLVTMHDDAYLLHDEMGGFVSRLASTPPRLGWVGTLYDCLAAWKVSMLKDVGELDRFLPYYGCDVDFFLRMESAGWEKTDDPIRKLIVHNESTTIKTLPEFKRAIELMQPYVLAYLKAKWGERLPSGL